jgi:nitrogen regulatory protein P-II 2
MELHPKKLLVIITEAALEKRLIAAAKSLGAQGYTVHDVRGGSERATHEGLWEADRTIELKLICDAPVAQAIAAYAMEHYASNYGLSMYFTDVSVLRPQKY